MDPYLTVFECTARVESREGCEMDGSTRTVQRLVASLRACGVAVVVADERGPAKHPARDSESKRVAMEPSEATVTKLHRQSVSWHDSTAVSAPTWILYGSLFSH